ncbi:FMN-dependent NADH-azoreductase 2 [Acidobacteriia bacterium SbA2]|nr:FMN-dependent NADH-azoreductase 2 [Acidobacteriia bacterium SbA2]
MPTLLYVSVSPRGKDSISRRLGDAAVEEWKARNPGSRVIERDLAKTPLTFVDVDWIAGAFSPPEYHTENHKKALALSNELVSELLESEEIILATPMFNFAVPAALKAWIDHVVRAGKTFRYKADGTPEGLLAGTGKKVLVIVASGGSYPEGSSLAALNYEMPYLRFILGFMGLTDVRFIHAGGTASVMQGRISPEEFLTPYLNEIVAMAGNTADQFAVKI